MPTRPKNISSISTTIENADRYGDSESDRPTVDIAEIVSYMLVISGTPSLAEMRSPPNNPADRFIVSTVIALTTISDGILRFENRISDLPAAEHITAITMTPSVPTFTPPAVEPEAPPISIRNIQMSFDESVSAVLPIDVYKRQSQGFTPRNGATRCRQSVLTSI